MLIAVPALALSVADARARQDGKPTKNGRILLSTRGTLVSIQPDGEGRRRVRRCFCAGASFSPDGRLITFSDSDKASAGDIFIARADGSDPRRVTRGRPDDRYPVFTPNGKRIVFERGDLDNANEVHPDLHSITIKGKRRKQLTATGEGERAAAISPDGEWIAYTRFDFGVVSPIFIRERIWIMRANGSDQRPLSLPQSNPFEPGTSFSGDAADFSRSGRRVFFRCPGGICVIGRDSDGQRWLIGQPPDALGIPRGAGGANPKVSPDGRRIAYAATISGERAPSFELRVSRTDGSGTRTLFGHGPEGGSITVDDWQPKPVAPRRKSHQRR